MNDICASILLASGWLGPRELCELPREQWRPALIQEMARQGVGEYGVLRAKLNDQLALTADIYIHLRDGGRDPRELGAMSPSSRREALLQEIHERRGTPLESMRDCDDERVLRIAATERLRERLKPMTKGLEDIGGAEPVVYGLVDDGGSKMDALKILPVAGGRYLGIYHTWIDDGFRLHVARSEDLVSWSRIAELGSHNHQGDIKPMGEGFIVANERDEPRGGSHLRFRYYASLEKLTSNEPCYDRNIPRLLSRSNEGTPDLRYVDAGEPGESVTLVGFHYYRRTGLVRKVDRLALGILSGFERWTPWIDVPANQAITGMGYKGNIGGRYQFRWDRSSWYIQEAQMRWKDWSSWRVLLGDGRAYIQLEPRTPKASRSFTKPCLVPLDADRYAASFSLPRQGNIIGEDGALAFGFKPADTAAG